MTTVYRLHKILGKLIAEGHGRKPVCIDKSSFKHVLEEDGVAIFDVETVSGPVFVPTTNDDGGTKWNADGSEAGRNSVVLKGGA